MMSQLVYIVIMHITKTTVRKNVENDARMTPLEFYALRFGQRRALDHVHYL